MKKKSSTRFELWIPVVPRAMKRPRVYRSGHAVSPTKETVDEIAYHLLAGRFRDYAKTVGMTPIKVTGWFFIRRPGRTKFRYPTAQRHGDLDNHEKTLLDAINQFIPDAQVCETHMKKLWPQEDTSPGIWLEVELLEDENKPEETKI